MCKLGYLPFDEIYKFVVICHLDSYNTLCVISANKWVEYKLSSHRCNEVFLHRMTQTNKNVTVDTREAQPCLRQLPRKHGVNKNTNSRYFESSMDLYGRPIMK